MFTPRRLLQAAPGYVTEKVYNALRAGAIPIYYGAPDVSEYLPSPHCVIDARAFPSGAALAEHVLAVAANETLFRSYLAWGHRDVSALMTRHGCDDSPYCQLCEHAAFARRRRSVGSAAPEPVGGNKAKASARLKASSAA